MDKYAKTVQSSYMYSRESPEKAKQYVATNLPQYHIHESLSDNHSIVLHNPKTNDVVIAYRGTLANPFSHPIQSFQDYEADSQIALGLHHVGAIPRQEEADAKYHRTVATFPGANIKVSGHSLGGVESYYVATKNNLEGHHFSIGESPLPGIETLNRTQALFHTGERYDKQHIYHADHYKGLGNVYNGSDPISEGTRYLAGQHHTVKVNSGTNLKAHDLLNFISKIKSTPKNVATFSRTDSLPPNEFNVEFRKHKKKHSHKIEAWQTKRNQ